MIDNLQIRGSLASWREYLEQPGITARAIFILLLIHSALLAYSDHAHSPTDNEPGHLVAGLSHWKFGRFELYRVNPPLVRMVAALPVIAAGYEEDWSGFYDGPGTRPVFGMGANFLAANAERSFFLLTISRLACIPFSWIGGIVCYLWARDLSGKPAGVLACAMWCFSPNVLANASLITADAGGAALGLAACYTFWCWLKKPSWTQSILTGCVLGMAELAKTTLVLFYPLWPVLWVFYRWNDRHAMSFLDWLREAGMLLARMMTGILILNLGYCFEGFGTPLSEFEFTSALFSQIDFTPQINGGVLAAQDPDFSPSDSAVDSHTFSQFFGSIRVPLPRNYLLGMDIQQRDFENYNKQSYLHGQWEDQGWWYYYIIAALIKVPLGTLVLVVLILLCKSAKVLKDPKPASLGIDSIAFRDTLALLFPALLIFVVVSSKTGFSEHFRYVLPALPFVFVWISSSCSRLSRSRSKLIESDGELIPQGVNGSALDHTFLVKISTAVLLSWSVCSSLWSYPHCLSYFNESVGGPLSGPQYLLGSSLDWGQDQKYAQDFLSANTGVEMIRFRDLGTTNDSLLEYDLNWLPQGYDSNSYLVRIVDILTPRRGRFAAFLLSRYENGCGTPCGYTHHLMSAPANRVSLDANEADPYIPIWQTAVLTARLEILPHGWLEIFI